MKSSAHARLPVNPVVSNETISVQPNVYPVDANVKMALFVIALAIVFPLINASKF